MTTWCPGIDGFPHAEVLRKARDVKKRLDDLELTAEFVAPRLWEDPRTIDGGYTSNDPGERKYAVERSVRSVEIAARGRLRQDRPLARARGHLYPRGEGPCARSRLIVEAVTACLPPTPASRS
jgi:xylose isomerase